MSALIRKTRRAVNAGVLKRSLAQRFGADELAMENARHVAVYPRLGIAYNRIKKNANSTTVALLYKLEHGEVPEGRGAKLGSDHLAKASFATLRSAADLHYMVIVRNPYSRVLSAFLNKFAKPAYVERFGEISLDRDGFGKFIDWLARDGLNEDLHWAPQQDMMFLPAARYDTILRFEDFPDALVRFLQAQDIDLSKDAPEILDSVNAETRSRAGSKLQQFYTLRTVEQIAELFRSDFDELGYSKTFEDAL
jgi:hypothetical protein